MAKTWFFEFINIWKKISQTKNVDETVEHQKLILKIFIIISIICFTILSLMRLLDWLTNLPSHCLPLISKFLILLAFIGLFKLTRSGKIKTISWLLIILYWVTILYFFIFWGIDSPAALIISILIIISGGILIGEKLVLANTVITSLFLITLTELQASGKIKLSNYSHYHSHVFCDIFTYIILLITTAAVIWIFCHEIKKSLNQARRSELELRQEKDNLENKILTRTRELRQLETEKIYQLYRLAELGRLSSGIFHDLVNPLTAISLNLEQIKNEGNYKILAAKSYLHQALLAAKKMAELIASIKKQIRQDNQPGNFLLNQEIEQIMQILAYKARQAKVILIFKTTKEIYYQGETIKFGQIIINLLANAIEACVENSENNQAKNLEETKNEVKIYLEKNKNNITVKVKDNGIGIAPENIKKIFEPFFSTKKAEGYGLGLGLSSTKNIIEQYFSGQIEVRSELNVGTLFIVKLPLITKKML